VNVLALETNLMWVSKLKLGLVGLGHTPTFTGRLPDDLGSFELAIVNLGEEPSRLAETVRRIQAAGLPIVAHAGHKEKELMELGASLGIGALATNSEMTHSLAAVLARATALP
jgi:hypothetical protein